MGFRGKEDVAWIVQIHSLYTTDYIHDINGLTKSFTSCISFCQEVKSKCFLQEPANRGQNLFENYKVFLDG